jgi:ribosomal protein S27AE
MRSQNGRCRLAAGYHQVVRRHKIDRQKVMASLATLCPKCGHAIEPREILRLNGTEIRCPKCSAVFAPEPPARA